MAAENRILPVMNYLAKYSLISYTLLLAGSAMVGQVTRGLSPVQTPNENTVAYISVISYDLFAVEPPAQSIGHSLRLYPQPSFDYNPDHDAGAMTLSDISFSQKKYALLNTLKAAVPHTYLRRLLYPFHSFL